MCGISGIINFIYFIILFFHLFLQYKFQLLQQSEK